MDKIDLRNAIVPPRGVKPRIAEQNDTHNAIDMEDPQRHHHGKKRDEDMPEGFDLYEDLAEVSIDLLRGFLQSLLDTKNKVQTMRGTHAPAPSYAMKAYQNAGGQTPPPPNASVVADAEVAGFSRLDLAAEALDKDEVMGILDHLASMKQLGITHLSIRKSDSFLQSIRDAILRA
jgi:hypothetical protein